MSTEYSVRAKICLSGEFAVVEGDPAVLIPASSSYQMSWRRAAKPVPKTEQMFQEIFKKTKIILNRDNISADFFKGWVASSIPQQSGLGSSAALVSLWIKWLVDQGQVNELATELDRLEFGRKLEDLYHGMSSGMDVACCLVGDPIVFQRGQPVQRLQGHLSTIDFKLFDSGLRSSTKGAVQKYLQTDEGMKKEFRQNMERSTRLVIKADASPSVEQALQILKEAFQISFQAFRSIGLVPDALSGRISDLQSLGYCIRLTGKGEGGYFVGFKPLSG